jgi:hypothetical protein
VVNRGEDPRRVSGTRREKVGSVESTVRGGEGFQDVELDGFMNKGNVVSLCRARSLFFWVWGLAE